MEKYIWQPILFSDKWTQCDTSILDDLAPSWYKIRAEFQSGNKSYEEFIERLKRRQAIETGAIENLYDVKRGLTENLVSEGLHESIIGHGEVSISSTKFMGLVKSQYDAVEFIFDLIHNNEEDSCLSKKNIREMHQILTEHQDYTDALDGNGNRISIQLIKGEFKKFPNNPKRGEAVYLYCPPEQVESEIEKLLSIYNEEDRKILENSANKVHPIILASWFHHAFTQIHPFQDGNGRVARLLASYVLIKFNLFPFSIDVQKKSEYINSLEKADLGTPQEFVDFFAKNQKRNIELALNLNQNKAEFEAGVSTQDLLIKKIKEKGTLKLEKLKEEHENLINKNRSVLFDLLYKLIGERYNKLSNDLGNLFEVKIGSTSFSDDKSFYNRNQILEYANKHDYFVKMRMPRAWFRITILSTENQAIVDEDTSFNLFFSIHHFGYTDESVAIGSWLETRQGGGPIVKPIEVPPLTLTLEKRIENTRNINGYIDDIMTIFLDWFLSQM